MIYCDECKSENIEIEQLGKPIKLPKTPMSQWVDGDINLSTDMRKKVRKPSRYKLTCRDCGFTVTTKEE
jgi:hypothetical protein